MLKNGICIAPEHIRTSLEIGNEQGVLIRIQGLSVRPFVRSEPVRLAPYLVYRSPDIAEEILGYGTDVCSLSRGQNFCRVEEESRRLIKHPGSLRLGRGAETPAHASRAEQAMPPGPTLDRGG